MEDWLKNIFTTFWVLVLVATVSLLIASFSSGIIGGFFDLLVGWISLSFDWIKQWWPAMLLAGIPIAYILFWFVLFWVGVGGLWIVVRVVRNAWRS